MMRISLQESTYLDYFVYLCGRNEKTNAWNHRQHRHHHRRSGDGLIHETWHQATISASPVQRYGLMLVGIGVQRLLPEYAEEPLPGTIHRKPRSRLAHRVHAQLGRKSSKSASTKRTSTCLTKLTVSQAPAPGCSRTSVPLAVLCPKSKTSSTAKVSSPTKGTARKPSTC